MTRPSREACMMAMAAITAQRSTCARRRVGAVVVDKAGKVLGTGYNGVAHGAPHCNENAPCLGAIATSGIDLDKCEAIHAEANALLHSRDLDTAWACFTTLSPCWACLRMLLATPIQHIVYLHDYGDPEIWLKSGRQIRRLDARAIQEAYKMAGTVLASLSRGGEDKEMKK